MAKFDPKGRTSLITKAESIGGEGVVKMLDITLLEEHPQQRAIYGDCNSIDEIKASIEKNGYKGNPVIVSHRNNKYTIISGHNRTQAARELGLPKIQCQIFEQMTELDENELLVFYNMQRGHRDLNPAVKARELAFVHENMIKRATIENKKPLSIREIGIKYFNYSSSEFQRIKEIMNADEGIKELLESGAISVKSMDDIAKLTIEEQKTFVEEINKVKVEKKPTVEDVKKLVNDMKKTPEKNTLAKEKNQSITEKPNKSCDEYITLVLELNKDIINVLTEEFGEDVNELLAQYISDNIDDIVEKLGE